MVERSRREEEVFVKENSKPYGRVSKKRDVVHNDRHESGVKGSPDVYGFRFST